MPKIIPDKPILNVPALGMATLLETRPDGTLNSYTIHTNSAPEVLTYYGREWYYKGTSDGMAFYTDTKDIGPIITSAELRARFYGEGEKEEVTHGPK
jgi:hypothetical protein